MSEIRIRSPSDGAADPQQPPSGVTTPSPWLDPVPPLLRGLVPEPKFWRLSFPLYRWPHHKGALTLYWWSSATPVVRWSSLCGRSDSACRLQWHRHDWLLNNEQKRIGIGEKNTREGRYLQTRTKCLYWSIIAQCEWLIPHGVCHVCMTFI